MTSLKLALCAGIAALALPMTMSFAETLAEKEFKATETGYISRDLKALNDACGTTMAMDIDWAAFQGAAEQMSKASASVNGRCSEMTTAVAQICRGSADGKEAVKKNIQKLSCTFGGGGKQLIELKAGTLAFGIDVDAANVGDAMTKYIKNNI